MGSKQFENVVWGTINRYTMLEPGDRVLVGVSGGADSMALLHYLMAIAAEKTLTLGVVHVHHGIRGAEADRDAAFVADFCQKEKIPCLVERVDVPALAKMRGESLETAGREIRQSIFKRVMQEKQYSKLALAHHGDDQAETLVMRLIRGTGLAGAAGIAPVMHRCIRPFLGVRRQDIENYCADQKIDYCQDSTNTSLAYTRNQIRHQVMPLLETCHRGAVDHLIDFTDRSREVADYLNNQIQETQKRLLQIDGPAVRLDIPGWQGEMPFMQNAMLHRALGCAAGSFVDIERRHIDSLAQKLLTPQTTWDMDLPYGVRAARRYQTLIFSKKRQKASFAGPYPITKSQMIFDSRDQMVVTILMKSGTDLKNNQKKKNNSEIILDYGRIKTRLLLRSRCTGDYMILNQGSHKKLKKFFIDQKVDRDKRDTLPLLAMGPEIIWIPGLFCNRRYIADAQSKKIIIIELEKV